MIPLFTSEQIGFPFVTIEQADSWNQILVKLQSIDPLERLEAETSLQQILNSGLKVPPQFLGKLQVLGYSISYNHGTIERFRTFSFPKQPGLEVAIRNAIAATGLLVDRNRMYRPGPASAKDCSGAAKGYDEIFSLFEQQTTEKKRIAKDTCNFIASIEQNLPKEHPWQGAKTLLDMACGNGVQTQEIVSLYPCSMIGIDNQAGCIANCQKLMPNQTFEVQDAFAVPPSQFKQKVDILFVSHFYCPSDKAALLIERLKEYQASENALIVFVNGCTGTDGDRIANNLPFLRGKPSSSMSSDFKKALETHNYRCIEKVRQAKVLFPPLNPMIRHQLLTIQRGDYENPYPNIDPDVKTFKALMEFIASFPLESMTQEEIALYLDELEKTFKVNGGPYLKICNQMLFAQPKNADKLFRGAFKAAEKGDSTFEQIQDKMESGFLEEAKDDLGNLLKSLEGKDLEKNIIGFQLMSDIYLQDEKYPEAAGILWYAKRLDENKTSHTKINARLDTIEQALLQRYASQEGSLRGINQAQLDQEKLKQLRVKIKEEYFPIQAIEDNFERTKALRLLYQQTITKSLKCYIQELAQDVLKQLATWGLSVPCEYALIGLGSLAREEMTPYSDFEFAILIDSEKEEDKHYFRLFTNLLHLRFINLGETILPSLDIRYLSWVFDTITPRGLSFDGSMPTACKTPIGKKFNRKGDYELIHTPKEMSQLQFIDMGDDEQERLWVLQRYHLPSILSACTYVTGSKEGVGLVVDYQHKVQQILQKEGKQRAADLMNDDLTTYKLRLENEETGRNYNVKKDLYRLPNTMFDGLANYFCLTATSTWERIEELEARKIFTLKAAQDLKELVMLSQELRLSTYISHGRQKDHLDLDTQKVNLKELYYRVLPFVETMKLFCKEMTQGSPEACLKQERFYQDSYYHQGIIAFRHMEYLEADRCLTLEVIDTLQYYEFLGAVKNTLAKYQEAEDAYLKGIEKEPSCDLYMKLGQVRQSTGRYKKEGSAEEAFFKAKELAEKSSDQLSLERVYRALTSLYKECGDYNSVRKYLSLCKEKSKQRTLKKMKDPEYGVVLDLDLAKTKELESHILQDLDSNFEKSGKLVRTAYRILKGYYRREDHPTVLHYTKAAQKLDGFQSALDQERKALAKKIEIFAEKHPDVATSYNNIGIILEDLGRHEEALENKRRALEIRIEIFGEKHPDVVTSYASMGTTFGALGRYQETLEHKNKALKMLIGIFGEYHPYVAISYDNLGVTLGVLGRYQEALENQIKALKISIAIFGEKHPHVATTYYNLGTTFKYLGQRKEAFENQSKALQLRINIFGERHRDVATSYNNVGCILGDLGRHEDGLMIAKKALKLRMEIFGEKHSDLASSYGTIGGMLGDLGNHKEALENKRKSLKIYTEIYGEKHPNVATSYNNVGGTLGDLGNHEEALEDLRKALKIRTEIFGEMHPDVANSYNNVGRTLGDLGNHEEALKKKSKALIMRIKIFGEMHPDVMSSYNSMGYTLGRLGRRQESQENLKKALKIGIEIFGEMHPNVAVICNNLGHGFLELKDYFSAIPLLKKALDAHQANPCYQLHLNILKIHNGLFQCYCAINDQKTSLQHFQESKNISKELDNQKAFQKNEVLFFDFLCKKEYRKAYNLFTKLPKYLQEDPQFLCSYLQIALLCPDLKISVLEKRIQAIETALNKQEGSILTRLKLCVNLATYWLNQTSSNKWGKAYECVKQLNKILAFAPTLSFKYEFLDLLAFGDNPLIEGECIPAEVLCHFIALKVYQGNNNSKILPIIAKQLLQKMDACGDQGHKIKEIKSFCHACLNQ